MTSEIRTLHDHEVLFVNDSPYYCIGGEVHNSDSSSPEYMEHIWKTADDLGMNTLLLPVSWEMIEPQEGIFDFSSADVLIRQAEQWKKKVIFLWFGSWKNAEMMYAPAWVKKDRQRFRRAQIIKGEDKSVRTFMGARQTYYSLSYLCEETMRADGRAFAALMAHIRDIDQEKNTVIGVQVENETGLLGAAREQSDEADAAFAQNVPEDFVRWMRAHKETMTEDVRTSVENGAESGTWKEVFGSNAEEIFSAYYVSRFVNGVAEQGKKVYDLPMFANCWLAGSGVPGNYPSGGPVSRMHEVWRYCAPCISVLCPDIYVPEFLEVCDDYTRTQPLFIPEAATHSYAGSRLVYSIGHYHAMCFSPFGFDDIGKPFTAIQGFMFGMDVTDPALKTPQDAGEYGWFGKTLNALMPVIAARYGTDQLQAVCAEEKKDGQVIHIGKLKLGVSFRNLMIPMPENGCVLAVSVSEDEFYLIAYRCALTLEAEDAKNLDILDLEEGTFENGSWKRGRRLNGDEAAFLMFEQPVLLRLKIHTYND